MIEAKAEAAAGLLSRVVNFLYLSRRRIATAAVGVLAVVIAYHAVFGENGAVAYQKKRAEFREVEKQVQQVQAENDRLAREIHALKSDPKAIEREAREQLRYAKPGEVVYLLPAPPQKDTQNVDARK